MNEPQKTKPFPLDPLVEILLGAAQPPVNQDRNRRIEVHANDDRWQPTNVKGLNICVLEYLNDESSRMTALLKLDNGPEGCGSDGIEIPANGLELLVQHGIVADDDTEYLHPYYIRQPEDRFGKHQTLTLYPGGQSTRPVNEPLEFYIATGQLAATDKQRRCINLNEHSLWLPGPVENTQVMPLHMHNGNNSMLVRWLGTGSFRPKLDPRGEEVLVISGTLTDEHGTYESGSWIRNPIAAWQTWSGGLGTLIYYKNGHFGTEPN